MKALLQRFCARVSGWNLFVGVVIGVALGVMFMNCLIPDANKMIAAYHNEKKSSEQRRAMSHEGHNPYMMASVTSEEQFLKDMILHHEAAVLMAQQVLALSPSANVTALAEAIIKAQSKEIADMKAWMK